MQEDSKVVTNIKDHSRRSKVFRKALGGDSRQHAEHVEKACKATFCHNSSNTHTMVNLDPLMFQALQSGVEFQIYSYFFLKKKAK